MTYLIEPYFLAGVMIASFCFRIFVYKLYVRSKMNKLKVKIKELNFDVNAPKYIKNTHND